ncbi:SH3 domain-containing protein [Glutamicibacter sp. JC586]|uniref:SH3 domain-containing protein n=1 Tax=Glutamicibacter sp. JC586 TaxID=2590552 RepID=UPI001356D7A1|nr:SH3 domain-containing protein [Glutamicibacter sp. JC586]
MQSNLAELTELALIEVIGSWAHVFVNGIYGWLPNIYLEPIPTVFDKPVVAEDEDDDDYSEPVLSRYSLIEATHVTTATLNLRKGSGTGYPVLKVIDQGSKVRSILQQGLWSQVQAGKLMGWVPSMYLQEIPARPARGGLIAVPNQRALTTIRLNARRGPGDHYSLVRILPADTAVVIVARQGAWRQIDRDGDQMWVPASQLRTVY